MNFAAAFEAAQTNPILIGGIGTVLFGSLMYVAKGVPVWCFLTLKRMLTVEVTLTSRGALYSEILGVLSRHRVSLFARNFTTDTNGDVVAGYGSSVAVFRGRLILFDRQLIEKNLQLEEKIKFTLFSRKTAILQALVDEASRPVESNKIAVYSSQLGGYWGHKIKKRRRSLDTVFANASAKEAIVSKIKWFLANEDWYLRRGIPYKLVFLLHGEPGTGKSSLIYAIASEFRRTLATVGSIGCIDMLLRHAPNNSIVAIEDIDMLTVSREGEGTPGAPSGDQPKSDEEQQAGLSALQVLINALDGLGTPHGLILFITTNYRERLDHALIRPGRVDCDIEITRLDRTETEAMYVAFYGEDARPLIRDYTSSPGFEPHTGADLQVLFMTETAEHAVRCLRSGERRIAGDRVRLVA